MKQLYHLKLSMCGYLLLKWNLKTVISFEGLGSLNLKFIILIFIQLFFIH